MNPVSKVKMMSLRSLVKSKSVSEREDEPTHRDSLQRKHASLVERDESTERPSSAGASRGFSGALTGGFSGLLSRTNSGDASRSKSPLMKRSSSTREKAPPERPKSSSGASSKSSSGNSNHPSSTSKSSGVPKSDSTGTSSSNPLKKSSKSHSIDTSRGSSPLRREGKPPLSKHTTHSSDDVKRDVSRLAKASGSAKERSKTPEPSSFSQGHPRSHSIDTSTSRNSNTPYRGFASSPSVGTSPANGGEESMKSLKASGRSASLTSSRSVVRRNGASADGTLCTLEALTQTAGEHLEKLKSGSDEEKLTAAEALRTMAKAGQRQGKAVVNAGAIGPLTELLKNENQTIVEHAVTTLLNVALDEKVRTMIKDEPGFFANVTHVLSSGTEQAKANAAAAFCCLSTLPGVRESIVNAGALPGLLTLLKDGQGDFKRDAANCLLSLCISRETRLPIAKSGLVKVLVDLLQDSAFDCDEQAAGIFAALARIPEGREVLLKEGGLEPLAELLECGGSESCKEYAVTALVGLAVNNKECVSDIDDLGLTTSLDVLSRTGSQGAQAKAKGLLELLSKRNEG